VDQEAMDARDEQPVFYVRESSSFALPDTSKGSDASNPHDEEVGPEVYLCSFI
jgi:hypothetical protein